MKKVKCISEGLYDKITKNKIYSVVMCQNDQYLIKNDKNMDYWYPKRYFEIVEDSVKEATPTSLADQVRALEIENQELKLKLEQIKKLLE